MHAAKSYAIEDMTIMCSKMNYDKLNRLLFFMCVKFYTGNTAFIIQDIHTNKCLL